MKRLFYLSGILLVLFELARVYFIMPMPGSQEMESISIAYFLYANRWWIRGILILVMLFCFSAAWKGSKILMVILLLLILGVSYMATYKMSADTMFYQPKYLSMRSAQENKVEADRIIMGLVYNGQAKAYPIQYLGYHHQVRDTIGGKPVMVTYCTVCRTGRVFDPTVNNMPETFRLVGMDHYNAMFEDKTTKSWWRQVTGEAVAGPLKGQNLVELPYVQMSLKQWLTLYPDSKIMQPDSNFNAIYKEMSEYEKGRKEGTLTVYDSTSWNKKSWIAGIAIGEKSKAWDWNELKEKLVINDTLGSHPLSIILSSDHKGLFAYSRSSSQQMLSLHNDTLTDGVTRYAFSGKAIDTLGQDLKPLQVYQEYWHSWKAFHPNTTKAE